MTSSTKPLRIIHVFRAPLGGLFRHVLDLTREQIARGHEVGLIVDSLTGGESAEETLARLEPQLPLGILRIPMQRAPSLGDPRAALRVAKRLKALAPDVVHGHGAKGGLYARLSYYFGLQAPIRAYTPHGGSFNFHPGSTSHSLYMAVEKFLARATSLLLFESAFIGERFDQYVGPCAALRRVIVNGLCCDELKAVAIENNPADLIYVGELRSAKGIDTLLDSLPLVAAKIDHMPTLILVGTGPDESELNRRAEELNISSYVRFAGGMNARCAFALGRILVVPSRAESLPYVVLEAAGARVPMIATNVGGIPEIFGPYADRLIPCDDPAILAGAIIEQILRPRDQCLRRAEELGAYVGDKFTLNNMAEGVLAGYRQAIAIKSSIDSSAA